jgi:ABC-2 type transport system permease protein
VPLSDRRLVIAKRELAGLRKEKTILLALAIQLFIAAFSSFLVVGLVSLYDPGSVGGQSIDVAVAGNSSEELLAVADRRDGLEATRFGSPLAATAAFQNGHTDAVLIANRGTNGRTSVQATVPDGNVQTTLVVVELRETLRAFERTERDRALAAGRLESAPLALPPEQRSNPYYDFTYTVLVPLLIFLPVFISGSITVDSITEELDSGTLSLLRVAPLSFADILDGKLLAAALLAPVQALLWMGLLTLNGTQIANLAVLIGLVCVLSVFMTAIGVIVSLLAPDRRIAQPAYSVCALGFVGAGTALPHGPVNTIARLAIDSADLAVMTAALGYGLFAVAVYAAMRWLIGRTDPATL